MSRKLLWSLAAIAVVAVPWQVLAQELPRAAPGAPGTVTMTRAEYDRLADLAGLKPPRVESAPIAAALTRADIRVRVTGSTARATLHLDGEVFRPGVARVPLVTNATLLDARMDNKPLPLVSEGTTHVALVAGPGTFSATLEIGSALTFTPGRGSFVLPVPAAGSATATIDVPGDQTDVHLSSGLILRRSSAGGRTSIDATLAPSTATEVWWSTHDSAPTNAASRDVRLLSDVKSIVTIGDAEVRLVSLVNATVVQGAPSQIAVAIPAGYEVISVSGASLERSETAAGGVTLFLSDPALRRHQFLVSLERPYTGGSFKLETSFPTIPIAQRETGEVAIEGLGTVEVTSVDVPGLRRMDVREVDPSLAAAARQSLLAAYRYQRASEDPPKLALDVHRFADAAVLSAIAERAVATTLITTEGRALTEVTMWIRNRAQPFMKVVLPPGASMLSVEVAGSPAKPAEAKDGSRVPLLRPGFRPDGPYVVSFVYLHAGTPFVKKGEMQVTLPKMDVPINVVEWELFVPDRYRVDHFDGNTIDAGLVVPANRVDGHGGGTAPVASTMRPLAAAQPGQINGRLVDPSGAPLPGVTVVVAGARQRQTVITDEDGAYVASNVPSGPVTVTGELSGFKSARRAIQFDQRGQQVDLVLTVSGIAESVEASAASPIIDATRPYTIRPEQQAARLKVENDAPSVNVQNLQRRASGVLPVRMEVPRAGTSHRFVKPLVIDEETLVTFRYKRR